MVSPSFGVGETNCSQGEECLTHNAFTVTSTPPCEQSLFVRDRLQLKLKDEEAEIELTGSWLEEEANVAEIEED